MAKAVILKTSVGTRIMGALQDCSGNWFDAEGCFNYCNDNNADSKHQASKLINLSSDLGNERVEDKEWYKNRNNFIDVEIDYNTTQTYQQN